MGSRLYTQVWSLKIIIITGILVELAAISYYKIIQIINYKKSMGLLDGKENPGSKFTCTLFSLSIFVTFSDTIT